MTEAEQQIANIENRPLMEAQGDRASSTSLILDSDSMNSALKMAELMATSTVTIPDHLREKPGDCMAIILQAMNWGMNPFVVAQKTHIVSGKLGYEAQLVNAVVQSQGFIVGSFHYEYSGDGESLQCRVGAVLRGEQEIRWGESLVLAQVKTRNSPLWKTNPKQQLGYLQVKNWARSFCPGAILGVYSVDELQEHTIKEVNPRESKKPYADEKFAENFPIWVQHVKAGKSAMAIITHLSNNYALTMVQLEKLNKELASVKPAIDGEVVKPEKKESPPEPAPAPEKGEEKKPYEEPPADGNEEAPY